MATRTFTSAGSNNLWSTVANWDTLPVDNDAVVIPAGQICEFDVDMSNAVTWPNGINGITVAGELRFATATGTYFLKLKTGSTIATTAPSAVIYASLVEFKARFKPKGSTDTLDDTVISAVLSGVSRLIDEYTHRRFYTSDADETKYYTPDSSEEIFTDDILSVTSLATDDGTRAWATTWAATDYDLMPFNATPYSRIRVTPNGSYYFDMGLEKSVKVVGKFGYCTLANLPAPVKEVCLIQAGRLWKRKDAIFGVMGSAEMGQVMVLPKLDPDVSLLLESYRRLIG